MRVGEDVTRHRENNLSRHGEMRETEVYVAGEQATAGCDGLTAEAVRMNERVRCQVEMQLLLEDLYRD